MIRVTLEDGRYLPVFVCDRCNRTIWREGAACWAVDANHNPSDGLIYHVHEGCYAKWKADHQALAGGTWVRDSIVAHPLRLLHNLGVTAGQARRMAQAWGIG